MLPCRFCQDRDCPHYAHWFSPHRGEPIRAINAMKFDAFLDLDFGSHDMKKPIEIGFDGQKLFYNESDGCLLYTSPSPRDS